MDRNYLDGKYYRVRAEECRGVAQTLAVAETRTKQELCFVLRARMLKVAADYELMAEVADNFTDNAGEPNSTKNVQ
jgi:hypothetical protein